MIIVAAIIIALLIAAAFGSYSGKSEEWPHDILKGNDHQWEE